MNIHERTCFILLAREEIWRLHSIRSWVVVADCGLLTTGYPSKEALIKSFGKLVWCLRPILAKLGTNGQYAGYVHGKLAKP